MSPEADLSVSAEVREAWTRWLAPEAQKVHAAYQLEGDSLAQHMDICAAAAAASMRAALERLAGPEPTAVLDFGSSAGFNAFALQAMFPQADVRGVEPEVAAVELARAMAAAQPEGAARPTFEVGVGEELPYESGSFDLVVSITVIEHVQDVERCVQEIARVLRPGGTLYLEAPNYTWPFEPHTKVVMPPRCPRTLLPLLARIQRGPEAADYVRHLQLVHPRRIERAFASAGLQPTNLYREKLERAFSEGESAVMHYRRLGRLLGILGRSRVTSPLARMLERTGLYPSLLYAATRST